MTDRIRVIREGKLFAPWDLLVYAVTAVVIVVLFLVFVVSDIFRTDDAEGIRVEADGQTVYTYVFGKGGSAAQGWEKRVTERTEGGLLYVRIELQDGWNELLIDGDMVRMFDADCSMRKDCTHMRAIGEGGSVITCIPHKLKVVPLEGEDISAPSVG